jgi:hypothetical protein
VEGGEARVGRAERAAMRRREAELGVARVGFGCAIIMMRSEVDRGGVMMVGTEVSVSTSGSPSVSGVAWAVLVSSKRMIPSD